MRKFTHYLSSSSYWTTKKQTSMIANDDENIGKEMTVGYSLEIFYLVISGRE
jgi:hypothetical protein